MLITGKDDKVMLGSIGTATLKGLSKRDFEGYDFEVTWNQSNLRFTHFSGHSIMTR